MAMETITGWHIERHSSPHPHLTAQSIPIASFVDTGTSASVCCIAYDATLEYLGGHLTANFGCLSPEGACMDFRVGDIVRVDTQREPYPEELGIIISVYPGFAWANYVRFPFANKEMLISTRWLSKVGEVTE